MFAVVVKPGTVTVPVNVGDANGDFKSNAVCVAVETGLLASEVLLQFPSPTIVEVIPETVPVNVGDAKFAFNANAVVVAVETGLLASEVLSQLPRPTMVLSIPLTVPVNVGDARVAYALKSGADILLIAV